MKKKILIKTLLSSAMVFSCLPIYNTYASSTLEANFENAVEEIIIPRYEEDGTKTNQQVSEHLKAKLDQTNLKATKDGTKLIVDFQIKEANLTTDYKNGKSPAGMGYYNMLNFYVDILQVKQLLTADSSLTTVQDSKGATVDTAYIDELLGLLKQINDFDTSTNLKYNMDSVYDAAAFKTNENAGGFDVIATSKEGKVTLKFHIDSHGWWGYDLGAHDSITGLVMGLDEKTAFEKQSEYTRKYGNMFTIEMPNAGTGKMYLLNTTDLENPVIYVSADGKEAFMIDVDMYGVNVLNKVIKEVIGNDCESLKIFITHNHPDHINNLEVIAKDARLKEIVTVMYPKAEQHNKLLDLFTNVEKIEDLQKFSVAGNEFQYVEIPEEHTIGGGQVADLTNKIVHVGDTLGAQVHLGGTTVMLSSLDNWISGMNKTIQYAKDNGIKYYIGGHTPYLNTTDFAKWVLTACEYAKEQLAKDITWKGGLTVVENGKVVSGERLGEMFSNGLTDREELNIASVNFRNNIKVEDEKEENKKEENNYSIIEGNNSTWVVGNDGTLTIRGSGDYDKFVDVKVDGKVVDKDNYTVASGSTIITFKKVFLDTLSAGKHTVEMVWTDGTATTSFTVNSSSKNTENKAPETGDSYLLVTSLLTLLVSGLGVLYISKKKEA